MGRDQPRLHVFAVNAPSGRAMRPLDCLHPKEYVARCHPVLASSNRGGSPTGRTPSCCRPREPPRVQPVRGDFRPRRLLPFGSCADAHAVLGVALNLESDGPHERHVKGETFLFLVDGVHFEGPLDKVCVDAQRVMRSMECPRPNWANPPTRRRVLATSLRSRLKRDPSSRSCPNPTVKPRAVGFGGLDLGVEVNRIGHINRAGADNEPNRCSKRPPRAVTWEMMRTLSAFVVLVPSNRFQRVPSHLRA